MNSEINLISNNDAASIKEQKRLKTVRYAAVVCLILVALISVLIFVINSQIALSSIKKDENSTLQSISSLNSKAAKLTIINSRVKDISTILQKRKNYTSAINTLQQQMTPDVHMTSLELDKNDILFVVNSNSLLSLNKFLDNIITLASNNKLLNSVLIESLTVNEKTGSYALIVKATLL